MCVCACVYVERGRESDEACKMGSKQENRRQNKTLDEGQPQPKANVSRRGLVREDKPYLSKQLFHARTVATWR